MAHLLNPLPFLTDFLFYFSVLNNKLVFHFSTKQRDGSMKVVAGVKLNERLNGDIHFTLPDN